MCGIAGFASRSVGVETANQIAQAMAKTLRHRGPDSQDALAFRDESGWTMGLAHSLLAIIGRPGEGRQPFVTPEGTLVFNGAIYNHDELRAGLRQRGRHFRTSTDTEVLAQGLAEEGTQFLRRIRGMFAFAFWDSRLRKLVLGRDPFGVKPLYYAWDAEALLFGSEYKVILPHLRGSQIDSDAVAAYLALRYVPGEATLVRDVRKVPAGTVLIFSPQDGSIDYSSYFRLEAEARDRVPSEEIFDSLKQAVERRAVADVEVGALLSGGVDSGIVCDLLQRSVKDLRTYTLRMADDVRDESREARVISTRIGARNEAIPSVEGVGYEDLERLIYHLDDPYGDPIILALDTIFKAIRGRQRVIVTGEGSDEIFSGYIHHRAMSIWNRMPLPESVVRLSARGLAFVPKGGLGALLPFAARLGSEDYREAVNRFERFARSPDLNSFQAIFHLFGPQERRRTDLSLATSSSPATLGALRDWDFRNWLTHSQLFKLDKIAMASSIEAREPFVDVDLIRLIHASPAKSHMGFRIDKPVLRRAVQGRLRIGSSVVNSRKTSFFQPFHSRAVGDLPSSLRARISDAREFLGEYVHGRAIDRVVEGERTDLLAQKRLFALGALVAWRDKIWSLRGSGVSLNGN